MTMSGAEKHLVHRVTEVGPVGKSHCTPQLGMDLQKVAPVSTTGKTDLHGHFCFDSGSSFLFSHDRQKPLAVT